MAGIKVRAFQSGFFGGAPQPIGSVFEVPETTFRSNWFEPVDKSAQLKPKPKLTPREQYEAAAADEAKRKREAIERAKAAVFSQFEPRKKEQPIALSQLGPVRSFKRH